MTTRAEDADTADQLEQFYNQYHADDIGTLATSDQSSLVIDWADLVAFDHTLADEAESSPSQFKRTAERVLTDYADRSEFGPDVSFADCHVRIRGRESTPIRDLRAEHTNQLVAVEGIVRKATSVRPKVEEAAFECQRCGTLTYIPQDDNDLQEPHECQGCERQGPFGINFDQSVFNDSQTLRVQERPEGLRGGATPEKIDVHIEDDICGEVMPGDHVTAMGPLRLEQQGSDSNPKATFDVYMEGWTVTREETEFRDVAIDGEDKERIRAEATDDNVVDNIIDSLAPGIYGYRDEKLGIALVLFSGVTKHLPTGERIRGDLHMLSIGDPGTAKSQLLSYASKLAPRGVYTSGKGSSAAGLTASAVKDDFADGDQWSLEAGALVLADKGLAAIDELDKMSDSDRSAMHEALEQQEVSISKAGINATLKSRCSVLGAANPKYGRFDQYEPLGDQFDLEPALISRFDLIFTITDDVDPETDGELADHVLTANRAGEQAARGDEPDTDAVEPTLDIDLLQKYIAYARQTCFPEMTDDAQDRLREFYVSIRQEGSDDDAPVPITARKLEALVRLAEASARMHLRERVTTDDAERAIRVVQACLDDIGMDPESGEYDVDRVAAGTTKSQRDRIRNIKELVGDLEDEHDDLPGAPLDAVLDAADARLGMDESTAEHELDKLQQKGELYKPKTDVIRTT